MRFTRPVPVGWVALTVLICPLVGWVGCVASRPAWFGACRWAKSRCQGPFLWPPSDSLPKSELHKAGISSYPSPDLLHSPQHLTRGRPLVQRRWTSEHVTDEWRVLLRGSWAGLTLDQGPGDWFRGMRGWDSCGLGLGWGEEKVLPPSPSHKNASPRRATTLPAICHWDLSKSSFSPWPWAELQTLSRPAAGSQGTGWAESNCLGSDAGTDIGYLTFLDIRF